VSRAGWLFLAKQSIFPGAGTMDCFAGARNDGLRETPGGGINDAAS
jgi:hypothetical protein